MVQEVRSILFADDECRAAVAGFVSTRMRGGLSVEHVELGAGAKQARVTLSGGRGQQSTYVMEAGELMSAVLLFCRQARIPLSSRSQKRLGLIDGKLALTTSINLNDVPPTVADGAIVHVASGPDLSLLHTTRPGPQPHR